DGDGANLGECGLIGRKRICPSPSRGITWLLLFRPSGPVLFCRPAGFGPTSFDKPGDLRHKPFRPYDHSLAFQFRGSAVFSDGLFLRLGLIVFEHLANLAFVPTRWIP